MKRILSLITFSVILNACGQDVTKEKATVPKIEKQRTNISDFQTKRTWTLSDFYTDSVMLDKEVTDFLTQLDDTAMIAQLIMPAVGRLGETPETIEKLVKQRKIGGVLMLNGTEKEFTSWISNFNKINETVGNPGFLYSADAEPSLFNRKISDASTVKKANEIKSIDEVRTCADTIAATLKRIGINYNFAPVVDVSKNATVGYRGFGKVPANNVPWSQAFIDVMQKNGIIGTAKHFPGHGLVSGDTHKALQAIDGELKEVKNYPSLIEKGVLSIMIGHLAVVNNPKYNTNGLPATCSKVIVTDLLRKELNFKGLIVTDAMNMGGVTAVPNNNTKAIEAGVDIILMPVSVSKTHAELLAKYQKDAQFKLQVQEAVKRIIRMKMCLGVI